jgi:hypothetical protein
MNIAIIPARGGSKRIPRKNIKLFGGKPMIAYAIEAAKASGSIIGPSCLMNHWKSKTSIQWFRELGECNSISIKSVTKKHYIKVYRVCALRGFFLERRNYPRFFSFKLLSTFVNLNIQTKIL